MIKKLLLAIAVIVAGILLFALTKPDTFQVQRQTHIKAPPEAIAPLLTDFHRWAVWSPWEKLDPAMRRTFSGAENGKGAIYAWQGNSDVGQGRMEIAAVSPSKVDIDLDFLSPFESHNKVVFALQPQGDGTLVAWTMNGDSNYMSKVMQVFISMDSMIGKDFDSGLAALKTAAEQAAAPAAAADQATTN
jgi:hypothetical protein